MQHVKRLTTLFSLSEAPLSAFRLDWKCHGRSENQYTLLAVTARLIYTFLRPKFKEKLAGVKVIAITSDFSSIESETRMRAKLCRVAGETEGNSNIFLVAASRIYQQSRSGRELFLKYIQLLRCLMFLSQEERDFVLSNLEILAQASAAKKWLKRNDIKKVIFMSHSIDPRSRLLSLLLYEDPTIMSIYYLGQAYFHKGLAIGADEVIFANKWALETYRGYGVSIFSGKVNYVVGKNYPLALTKKVENTKQIAIYTTGYYARLLRNHSLQAEVRSKVYFEQALLLRLRAMCAQSPDLQFTIFPHPTVEGFCEQNNTYSDFLSLPNVSMREKGSVSANTYHEFDLGISMLSNVFFERIESGHKAICCILDSQGDIFKFSRLRKVCLKRGDLHCAVLRKFLDMNIDQFQKLIDLKSSINP